MNDPYLTTVYVCRNKEDYDDDFPENLPLKDTIAWFQDALNQIPEAYRDSARCEINSISPFGDTEDSQASIEIFYRRPETEDEKIKRLEEHRLYLEKQKAKRDLYARSGKTIKG